jgi:hypothetical protein
LRMESHRTILEDHTLPEDEEEVTIDKST